MAASSVKFDDGASNYTSNCFPVRSLYHQSQDGEGAWLTAHQAEQRIRFKAILCSRPKTYSQIREERKKCERKGIKLTADNFKDTEEEEIPTLDGFFLMKHCCVDDPTDLCSVNISGKELSEVKEEDFALFDNVAYVNAAENYLPFEAFRGFQTLRELELPLNGLRSLKINVGDFPHLELLDLSYNNLSQDDVLVIGLLQNLKVLHLSGNNFTNLPADMAVPYISEDKKVRKARYPKLEVLMLDDNKFSELTVFAALAGLQRLKHLNMEKNLVYYVPQLKSVEGRVVTQEGKARNKSEKSASKDASKSSNKSKSNSTLPKDSLSTDVLTSDAELLAAESTDIKKDGEEESKKPVEEEDDEEDLLNDDLSLNLDDITERMNELQGLEVVETVVECQQTESTSGEVSAACTKSHSHIDVLPPMSTCAFPELCYLSLAYNQILEEEGLLAVAAWPMLAELVIHNNPLTTETFGDPPLLKRFLQDRLGIKLIRHPKRPLSRPPIDVQPKKHRKVSSHVPKLPRPTLEDRLMLLGPESDLAIEGGSSETRPISRIGFNNKPLPPIGSKSAERESEEVEETTDNVSIEKETQPTEEEIQLTDEEKHTSDEEDFFMTQVYEQEEEQQEVEEKQDGAHHSTKKSKKKPQCDDRYRGYEELLKPDDFEDVDVCPPKDIQQNLRALKYALNHQLVYRDTTVRFDVVPRQVKQYRRVRSSAPPKKSRVDKVNAVLENAKTRSTVEEAPLTEVLSREKSKLRKQFPEAQALLAQIQRRYNTVRVHSMKEADEARKLIKIKADNMENESFQMRETALQKQATV